MRQKIGRKLPNRSKSQSSPELWPLISLLALALAGPISAESDLSAALQEQQALLDSIATGEPGEGGASLLQGVEDTGTDPRVAPRTPIPRDLPVAIFDEEKVTVPAGAWGANDRMLLLLRVLDADGDGKPEVQRYVDPKSDLMIRQIEDRNYDGVQDTWSDFEWGAVSARVMDTNDDGNPDTWETYAEGRMTHREVDRDDDGVRDAFYFFNDDSLTKEEHDSNNDGKVDLIVRYQARQRTKSEEDSDHDGRMDLWTVFASDALPSRIARDSRGRGFADIFEHFESVEGKAVLAVREEDVNGDGKVDIVSIYQSGKLVRREIADLSLLPGA